MSESVGRKTRVAAAGLAAALVAGVAGAIVTPAAPAQAIVAVAQQMTWIDSAAGTPLSNAMWDIDADILRNWGYTGQGVGVAMIDTGVAPVAGLTGGNVVNGPDLSFEGQDPAKRYVDLNGHGTHLAGIIAGKPNAKNTRNAEFQGGVAPGAKLTSVKVGSANGAVDVSQVIAAIDWVVAHRNDDPANKIRVLELAYGTDGVQSPQLDPLAHAVENAWRAGIVVVVAGGNDGGTTKLTNPATDPYVLAVGATDDLGNDDWTDDKLADFTSRGGAARRLDVAVPGRTILSLRAPGSNADVTYPGARVGATLFKGSGSSQAAALTAGSVALLLEAIPWLTNDQVKYLLKATGWAPKATLPGDETIPVVDLIAAYHAKAYGATHWYPTLWTPQNLPSGTQTWPASTGTGTLEGARGSIHVADGTVQLTGENDIFGPISTTAWAAASSNQTAWVGGTWMGHDMTGTTWTTSPAGLTSWTGRAWSGRAWSGRAWSGSTWSSISWQSAAWTAAHWN